MVIAQHRPAHRHEGSTDVAWLPSIKLLTIALCRWSGKKRNSTDIDMGTSICV